MIEGVHFVGQWLFAALAMFWSVLWSLLLGFMLSAMIQAYVPKGGMAAALGKAGVRELGLATLMGAASSSCSYAAAATGKSLFKRGASFTTAMVFMFAATNLVVELGFILWRLMGWQFVVAEWLGGLVLIAVFVVLARLVIPPAVVEEGRAFEESAGGGHAHDHGDMLAPGRTLADKLRSGEGWRYVSHYFQMDWAMVRDDLGLGFLIAGLLAVAVPASWWQHLFVAGAPGPLRVVENALVGPVIAMLSFVCSIGNVPLAAVLWQGGSSFGGVIAFLYADLIVIPLIDIYRKYYGWPLALRMVVVFFISMVVAGLIVEGAFALLHGIPRPTGDLIMEVERIQFDYTTALNAIFLTATAALVWWGNRPTASAQAEHGRID